MESRAGTVPGRAKGEAGSNERDFHAGNRWRASSDRSEPRVTQPPEQSGPGTALRTGARLPMPITSPC